MDKKFFEDIKSRDYKGDLNKLKEKIFKKSSEEILGEILTSGEYGNCIKDFIFCGERLVTLNDYLMVNNKGIFLVNVNKEKGTIYGEDKSETWHSIKNNKPHNFKNPLIALGETLEEVKGILDEKYKDKVVCKLIFTRGVSIEGGNTEEIILMNDLDGHIKGLSDKLTDEEVMEIYEELAILNVIDENIRKKRKRLKFNYEMNLVHKREAIEVVDRVKILNEMRLEG